MALPGSFEQYQCGILGSEEDILALSQKKEANALVVADSHGNTPRLKSIIEQWGTDSDALIFCGDGIRDLCAVLGNAVEDRSFALCIPPVIGFVMGNNDFDSFVAVNPLRKEDESQPYYVEVKVPPALCMNICGTNVFVSHGHYYGVYGSPVALCDAARENGAALALYGHTHVPNASYIDDVYAVNPGSCSLPRMGEPPTFARLFFAQGRKIPFCTFFKQQGGKYVPYKPLVSLW